MDYLQLNEATEKYQKLVPFINKMLDRLGQDYYIRDGYIRYNKILMAPEEQENTTFTFHIEHIVTT